VKNDRFECELCHLAPIRDPRRALLTTLGAVTLRPSGIVTEAGRRSPRWRNDGPDGKDTVPPQKHCRALVDEPYDLLPDLLGANVGIVSTRYGSTALVRNGRQGTRDALTSGGPRGSEGGMSVDDAANVITPAIHIKVRGRVRGRSPVPFDDLALTVDDDHVIGSHTIQTSGQRPKPILRPFGSGSRCRRLDHHEVDTQIAKLAEDPARSVCVDDDMVELSEICELEQGTASKLGVVKQQDARLG